MDRNDFYSWDQENDLPFRIQSLYDLGYMLSQISRKLNLREYSVMTYLPDRKASYGPRKDKDHEDLVLKAEETKEWAKLMGWSGRTGTQKKCFSD